MLKKKYKLPRNRVAINHKWSILITILTFALSIGISLVSQAALRDANVVVAFLILLLIICLGVVFDVIGLSVATATETPFHSLSSRRVSGAKETLSLIRSAQQVSSFCADVVGDISGIISGASCAMIATQVAGFFANDYGTIISLILTGLAAALTIGGKAVGKGFALAYNNSIMFFIGKLWYHIKCPFKWVFNKIK